MSELKLPEGAVEFDPVAAIREDDTVWEWVAVPEWKGGCWVRNLSSAERDQFEIDIAKLQKKKQGNGLIRATVVQRCASKTDKTPMFNITQVTMLARKNAAAVDRISAAILRLSGMSDADLEEVAKNSEAAPSGSSGYDSAVTSESST
jgi:hypothetical protein